MRMTETEEIINMNRKNTGRASRNGLKWRELNQDQKDQLVSVMKDLFLAEVEKIGRPLHDAEKRRLMRMLGGELRKRKILIPLRGIYYALWNRMTRWNKKCFILCAELKMIQVIRDELVHWGVLPPKES